MEDFICRIIQADLDAQERMKDIELMSKTYQQKIAEAKETLYQNSWSEAKAYVAQAKVDLDRQVQQENDQNTKLHETQMQELNQAFETQREHWRQEILRRCLQ